MPFARDFDAWAVMPLLVGMGRNPPNIQLWPFKGRIQEVVVYNEALKLPRIVSHASCFLGL